MLEQLHSKGLKSEHCYIAGMVSVGVAIASWLASRRIEQGDTARADRWGIFVGEWAPTLFAIGNGLRTYEK